MVNWCFIALGLGMLLQSGAPTTRPSTETSKKEQEVAALKKRAEAGDSKAQVQLGAAYASGDGVTEDDAAAVKWFRKAAEQGDAGGEYSLGEMYLTGRGVSTDLAEAVKWIRRAAEHGDARGEYNLAVMYAQGQSVPKDENEAAKWMRKAADQGLAAGQFGVGFMYAHGRGVPQSAAEAANWYRKAADQGDPAAMNNLAFLLATSTDPKVRDPKEAVAVAQKLVEAETDNPAYLDTLAMAYFEAGQPAKAAEMERRALTLKPDDLSYRKALDKYEAASQAGKAEQPRR
jgi:TPR repeat protein